MRRQDRTGDRQDADKSIPSLVRVWLLWQEGRPAAVADWWHNKWKSLSVRDHTWTVLIRTISWDTGGRWSVSVTTDIYILTLPDYSASPSHGSRTCRPSLLYSYNMYLYVHITQSHIFSPTDILFSRRRRYQKVDISKWELLTTVQLTTALLRTAMNEKQECFSLENIQ